MSSYKNLIIAVLLLLLAGGGLAIWNAERNSRELEPVQQDQAPANSDVIGKNVSFTVTEGEVKKWKLTADQAVYSENRTEAHLTGVRGEFYDPTGKPVMNFTAPAGEYTSRRNQVVLTGGVVAKGLGEKAGDMRAPRMAWEARSGRITASGGVEMIFPQGKSTAQVCRFTMDFSDIQLEGGVTSVIQP